MALTEEANEKPEPTKSMNIMLANCVALFALSASVLSGLSDLGPMPARFKY